MFVFNCFDGHRLSAWKCGFEYAEMKIDQNYIYYICASNRCHLRMLECGQRVLSGRIRPLDIYNYVSIL